MAASALDISASTLDSRTARPLAAGPAGARSVWPPRLRWTKRPRGNAGVFLPRARRAARPAAGRDCGWLPPAQSAAIPVPAPASSLADAIYRPFFLAGIVVVLTLGRGLGALRSCCRLDCGAALPRPGCTRSTPTATPRSSAGSACSSWALPTRRFRGSSTRRSPTRGWRSPRWCMLAGGIVVRSLAQPLVAQWPWLWWAAVGGSPAGSRRHRAVRWRSSAGRWLGSGKTLAHLRLLHPRRRWSGSSSRPSTRAST